MPAKKQAKVLVTCPRCGHQQPEPRAAISTACKQCGQYIRVQEVLKPAARAQERPREIRKITCFECGTELEVAVSDAIIKGELLGKLTAERSLTIYSAADIKGSFKAGRLVIPAENHFRWKEEIKAGSADIAGELAANLHADGSVVLRATGRLFGDVEARNLVIEEGAVMVGKAKIGV